MRSHDDDLPAPPARDAPRKADALTTQVRFKEQARIRLPLDAQGLQRVQSGEKSHTTSKKKNNKKGEKEEEEEGIDFERPFVRALREGSWHRGMGVDLWLEDGCLMGSVPQDVAREAAEAGLLRHIKIKVQQHESEALRWLMRC